ncbi:MAG TPA: PspC domain-containing protein [Polyangiaceae bacterium]|nr:PspC domain-containing protein [Polyangiaceae bacterium]
MTSPDASDNTPPPRRPAPAAPPRRLYRDPKGLIGGVASGFAEYFDVDPVITRLLWVVALLSGIGLPAYVLCWLIVPKAPSWPPPGYLGRSSGPASPSTTWLSGVVIIALAAMVGSGLDGFGEYLLPAALVGFGVYLLNQRPRSAASEPGDGGAAPIPDGADGAPAEGRPEPHSLVTPTVLSVLAIGAGTLLALGAAGVVHVSLATAAGIGLAIVGGGLVASLWLGRAPGLVPVGLGLLVLLLSASTLERLVGAVRGASDRVHVQVDDVESMGLGERTYVVTSLDDLQRRYEVGLGKLVLDLSQLDLTGQERTVELEVGLGEASVIVPRGAALEVRGEVSAGKATVLGHDIEGADANFQRQDPGTGAGTLRVELEVGLGQAEVRRAP